jgi:hypothetical protein
MGLDGVELVMEIEDHFGIEIPDSDAEGLRTVGGIHAYLCARLKGRPASREPCASRATYVRLRDALRVTLGIDPNRLRPSARISDVVRPRILNEHIAQMEAMLGLRLPIVMVMPRAFLVGTAVAVLAIGSWQGAVVGFIAGFLILLIGAAVSNAGPARVRISSSDTVRHLVRLTHRINGLPDSTTWTDRKIWDSVTLLVSNQFGVAAASLRPETDLLYDLGMG